MIISIKGKYQDCLSFKNFHLLILDILVCYARLFLQYSRLHTFKLSLCNYSNAKLYCQINYHVTTPKTLENPMSIMWLYEPMRFVLCKLKLKSFIVYFFVNFFLIATIFVIMLIDHESQCHVQSVILPQSFENRLTISEIRKLSHKCWREACQLSVTIFNLIKLAFVLAKLHTTSALENKH